MAYVYEGEVREEYNRQRRDRSPDYHHGGGAYVSGAIPPYASQPRLGYDDRPLSPRHGSMSLQVPESRYRPRSQPPPGTVASRRRSRSRSSGSSSEDDNRDRGTVGKARHAIDKTFSPSPSGIGVGILGAVVGGLAAREVSEAAVRSRNKKGDHEHRSGKEHDRSRMISTVVGALVGGLGANAIEKRIEVTREKNRDEQEAWEKKWGREGGSPRDGPRDFERDHGRGRPRGRREDEGWDRDDDFVYNDRDPRRGRSEAGYRDRY